MIVGIAALFTILFFGGGQEYFLIEDFDKGINKHITDKNRSSEIKAEIKLTKSLIKEFNKKRKKAGGFQGALIMPVVVPSVFGNMQFLGYDDCENSAAPISKIDAQLNKGNPVVLQVDYSPNAGVQSHWVVAIYLDVFNSTKFRRN